MTQIAVSVPVVARISILIYAVFLAASLFISGYDLQDVLKIMTRNGIIISVIIGLWAIFDNYLWKIKIFRALGLVKCPDLSGRWMGTVERLGESAHPFVMEVHQKFTSIKFNTYGRVARGRSLAIAMYSDNEANSGFKIYCVWEASARKPGQEELESFLGSSEWFISMDRPDGEKILEDKYYTERQTKGRICLRWIDKKCIGRFE